MSTKQIPPNTGVIVASVALKIIALIARAASYPPLVLFIIFSAVQVFMCLVVLADNGVSVSGVVFIILMLLVLAPIMMKGGSLDMTVSIAGSDIALSIGFWLIVLTICDLLIRKWRHKPLVDMTPERWLHKKTVLIYTAIYLVSTAVMLFSQPNTGEVLLVQILFYIVGLICYTIYRSINLLARVLFAKGNQLLHTDPTSTLE